MTLEEIKTAVNEGKTVHWSNEGYTVITDKRGQYLIKHINGSAIGLTWMDGKTLNGDEDQFYTVPAKPEKIEPPAGYRYAYGSLEKLPEEITAPLLWETETETEEEAEKYAAENCPHVTEWVALSPDRYPINDKTYETASAALKALKTWCKGFREQKGYRDGRGQFIPYADLYEECNIEPARYEDEDNDE